MTNNPESHIFIPDNSIFHTVNVRFLGLYSATDLPPYYRPHAFAVEFSERLMDRVVQGNDTEFVIYEEASRGRIVPEISSMAGRLGFIIGPDNLSKILGDREGVRSLLWDKGNIVDALNRAQISYDNLRIST